MYRFSNILWLFPLRVGRLWRHLIGRSPKCLATSPKGWPRVLAWCCDMLVMLLECVGVPEIVDWALNNFSRNIRPLTVAEMTLGREFFGENIPWGRVRILQPSWFVPRRRPNLAFVTFYVIHATRPMSPEHFIHELTHIWQYRTFGAVYIPQALFAQRTREGYNYGGLPMMEANDAFELFNLEQQADIMADTCRMRYGLRPVWGEYSVALQRRLEHHALSTIT